MAANQLDAATIAQLLASQKSRGEYDSTVSDFLKSGIAGIEIPLDSGVYAGKPAKTVKTGLDLARKRVKDGSVVHAGGDKLRVIVATEGEGESEVSHLYLINTALTGQDIPDDDETPTDEA